MIILSIETSCDETAVALVEAQGDVNSPSFKVLGNALLSQAKLHEQYGGVFPTLAKREHNRNLIPLFEKALEKAGMFKKANIDLTAKSSQLTAILNREPELLEQFMAFASTLEKPPIDLIAVTQGPGLEPALWVGISFAKALSELWDIPMIPTNHMEGHIASVLLQQNRSNVSETANSQKLTALSFPALALLISRGHTELIHIEKWGSYKKIGETQDDAVGEAFDKVARILGLPYPGGPEISRLASQAREANNLPRQTSLKPASSADRLTPNSFKLPRPMIHSKDLKFSFSGLKTAVLYMVEKIPNLTEEIKKEIAREFEDAVIDVLVSKTKTALEETGAKTLIIAGGVSANNAIRNTFQELGEEIDVQVLVPDINLSTDNAIMIALAGFIEHSLYPEKIYEKDFKALGNLSL